MLGHRKTARRQVWKLFEKNVIVREYERNTIFPEPRVVVERLREGSRSKLQVRGYAWSCASRSFASRAAVHAVNARKSQGDVMVKAAFVVSLIQIKAVAATIVKDVQILLPNLRPRK